MDAYPARYNPPYNPQYNPPYNSAFPYQPPQGPPPNMSADAFVPPYEGPDAKLPGYEGGDFKGGFGDRKDDPFSDGHVGASEENRHWITPRWLFLQAPECLIVFWPWSVKYRQMIYGLLFFLLSSLFFNLLNYPSLLKSLYLKIRVFCCMICKSWLPLSSNSLDISSIGLFIYLIIQW